MTNRNPQGQNTALDGITVLDLAQLITGPLCASFLGDFGARVIKIEPPGGESMRHIGPQVDGQGVLFLSVNRNKQSLVLDLAKPQGRALLDRLLTQADVLIHNFRPDVRRAYGLDYQVLAKDHPGLVYLSVSAFGEEGPYAMKPGTDHVFQGASGLMSLSGNPGQGPLRTGVPAADMTAAMLCTVGVLAALYHRQATGRGQDVHLNLLDAAMSLQQTTITEYLLTGRLPAQHGNSSPFASPVGMMATTDGFINIAVFNGKFWRALCAAVERPELAADPRFANAEARMENRDQLHEILAEIFRTQSSAHWLERLESHDVPCGPVHDYQSLMSDPQVVHNRLRRDLPHDTLGSVATLGNPLGLGLTPAAERQAAPLLGSHSEEILSGLGLAAREMDQLRRDGVI